MEKYTTYTGVGRQVEIWGLKGNYIPVLAGGGVFLFLLAVILSNIGLPVVVVAALIILMGTVFFGGIRKIYKRFGVHGIQKYTTMKQLPPFIRNRRGVHIQILNSGRYA